MSINCVTESYIYVFSGFFSFFNLAVLVLHRGAAIFVFFILLFLCRLNWSWIRRTRIQHDSVWVAHCHRTI